MPRVAHCASCGVKISVGGSSSPTPMCGPCRYPTRTTLLTKTCSRCGEDMPVSDYHKMKKAADGLHCWCKSCVKTYMRDRSASKPMKVYFRTCPVCGVLYTTNSSQRAYCSAQCRKVVNQHQSMLAKRGRDRTRDKEYQKQWVQANRDKVRAQGHRRRARSKAASVFHITDKDIARIYSQPCWKCGAKADQTLDHRIPLARGGTHGVGNFLTLCFSCNSSKGARLLVEWRYRLAS